MEATADTAATAGTTAEDGRRIRRRRSLLLAILAWWALYGLMLSSQLVNMGAFEGEPFTWKRALVYAYGSTWTWAPMTLVAYVLASRHPLGRDHVWRNIAIHALAILGFILAKAVYAYLSNPIFGWYASLPPFIEILDTSLRNNLTLGLTVVAMIHGVVYFERMEERESSLARLEKNLALAKLEAIKAQLNPHFLFNALNSVAELMQEDVEQADRMLIAVCAMLRDGLRSPQAQERPLREELEHVGNYLVIEGIRLGSRLSSSVAVAADCMEVPVPALSLQPLVENAIVHSIARSRAPGWIEIRGQADARYLRLTIRNSRTTGGERQDGNGLGQRAVEERLRLLYGARGRLQRSDEAVDVYQVTLIVPLPDTRDAAASGRRP